MLNITDKLILTAGPTISYKEVEYATDAALNGWNSHHSDYLRKFEETFANYIGVKYAMATSSCSGALHLALLALGIGPGDEVIVPDITWIATVSAVKYVGATPVFADIEADTWVMDPKSVAKLINPKTKAIIPVHLYGNPVEMGPIIELALKHGIEILEDAAPAIGAEYKGKKVGSLGKMAAVSFQGAKALVTGEGGMLVTNDKEMMERARFFGDHGRDPDRALCSVQIGYKYKMSNIQAALGLAQIERAEEIVLRKRQLFKWYEERLQDIEGIKLNVEKPWARSIFWMSSLVLGESIDISRDDFMKKLKERNIDTRPFFYPISSFPMFKDVKVNNPVAYSVPLRAVNLPSGHERTEEEIDYICAHVRDILGAKKSNFVSIEQPHGWLAYRDNVNKILKEYKDIPKEKSKDFCIPIINKGEKIGILRPLTFDSLDNDTDIKLLADWRATVQHWFPSQFKVTFEGTKRWLENQVLKTDDRILFMVESNEGTQCGHVGLFRFDYKNRFCELDNIVRGNNNACPGIMTYACDALIKWTKEKLKIENIYLRVVSDNEKALKLYDRLKFEEIQRMPLMKTEEADSVKWIEVIGKPYFEVQRYFVTMKLKNSN